MTPGQKIVSEAFAAFDAWCKEWDPEDEMSIEVQAANYERTCTMEREIERLTREVARWKALYERDVPGHPR